MMNDSVLSQLDATLREIEESGLLKVEQPIVTPQGSVVETAEGELITLCANNYLGLANHPDVVAAATRTLQERGFGMASVRFIIGTQDIHKQLEREITELLGTEDTILFPSCFDANGAIFETLLGADDTVVSDELNHASIIDGIRLSKAKRLRYRNRDMDDLRTQLESATPGGRTLVVTDGVFSMDGYIAPLPELCDAAEAAGAMVMVDDSHAVGFMGDTGAGTPEHFGVGDRVDIITGTLGKALGGGSGGYVSGRASIVALLRQRGRPYLFSNSIPPAIVGGSLEALAQVRSGADARARLRANAALFRELMSAAGFDLLAGEHPIIPVMIREARDAAAMAQALRRRGVYVTAFSYPVVPMGLARLRVQVSAAHTEQQLRRAVDAFIAARDDISGNS